METLQGYYSGLLTFLNSLLQEIPYVAASPEESQYLTSQITQIYELVSVQMEAVQRNADRYRKAA